MCQLVLTSTEMNNNNDSTTRRPTCSDFGPDRITKWPGYFFVTLVLCMKVKFLSAIRGPLDE